MTVTPETATARPSFADTLAVYLKPRVLIVLFLGFSAGLFAFTAAVFGGIGNIYGAAIGGVLIGIIRSFWDGYFDSAWTDVVIFSILILTLVFRPTGILGMRVPEK